MKIGFLVGALSVAILVGFGWLVFQGPPPLSNPAAGPPAAWLPQRAWQQAPLLAAGGVERATYRIDDPPADGIDASADPDRSRRVELRTWIERGGRGENRLVQRRIEPGAGRDVLVRLDAAAASLVEAIEVEHDDRRLRGRRWIGGPERLRLVAWDGEGGEASIASPAFAGGPLPEFALPLALRSWPLADRARGGVRVDLHDGVDRRTVRGSLADADPWMPPAGAGGPWPGDGPLDAAVVDLEGRRFVLAADPALGHVPLEIIWADGVRWTLVELAREQAPASGDD